jgi:hypothetical protein
MARAKKLTKDLVTVPGTVIITVADGEKGAMKFDFNLLPPKIQKAFGPFGLGHKLGDSAAGRAGKDAEEAITKVWDGLMKGDWSVRAPATPKVAVATVLGNLEKMQGPEKEVAKKLLEKLGISI